MLRKHVLQAHIATQDSSWNVPGKYKNGNGEKSNLKNAVSRSDKLEAANWQTGGGAKSALAFFWIDLQRFWHCKRLRWHPCEFKKVCKYGATMHIEGSRSLWRKIYCSGGLRSPNPLHKVGWGTWLAHRQLLCSDLWRLNSISVNCHSRARPSHWPRKIGLKGFALTSNIWALLISRKLETPKIGKTLGGNFWYSHCTMRKL